MLQMAKDFALEVLGDVWSALGRALREWKKR